MARRTIIISTADIRILHEGKPTRYYKKNGKNMYRIIHTVQHIAKDVNVKLVSKFYGRYLAFEVER